MFCCILFEIIRNRPAHCALKKARTISYGLIWSGFCWFINQSFIAVKTVWTLHVVNILHVSRRGQLTALHEFYTFKFTHGITSENCFWLSENCKDLMLLCLIKGHSLRLQHVTLYIKKKENFLNKSSQTFPLIWESCLSARGATRQQDKDKFTASTPLPTVDLRAGWGHIAPHTQVCLLFFIWHSHIQLMSHILLEGDQRAK